MRAWLWRPGAHLSILLQSQSLQPRVDARHQRTRAAKVHQHCMVPVTSAAAHPTHFHVNDACAGGGLFARLHVVGRRGPPGRQELRGCGASPGVLLRSADGARG